MHLIAIIITISVLWFILYCCQKKNCSPSFAYMSRNKFHVIFSWVRIKCWESREKVCRCWLSGARWASSHYIAHHKAPRCVGNVLILENFLLVRKVFSHRNKIYWILAKLAMRPHSFMTQILNTASLSGVTKTSINEKARFLSLSNVSQSIRS